MLLNKALGVPFMSYQDTLPNDSAVALRGRGASVSVQFSASSVR